MINNDRTNYARTRAKTWNRGGIDMLKIRIIQLITALTIAFITYKITGENYDFISWFGGALCLGILLIIREVSNE